MKDELPRGLAARLEAAGLDQEVVRGRISLALAEDLADGPDVTTAATIGPEARGSAALVARKDGVVAGLLVAEAVFWLTAKDGGAGGGVPGEPAGTGYRDHLPGKGSPDVRVTHAAADGDRVRAGQTLMTVSGPLRVILTAERTALNLLCHLSGIATLTGLWADAVAGTGARVRDTRKTLPGLRALEKYAVRCGGGVNHRMSLSDAALIKDNHVAAAGSVTAALRAVEKAAPGLPVEVECDTLDQVAEAIAAGAGLILLDNFTVADTERAVTLTAGRARLEASGGLTLASARAVAATGVDYLAVGALTHSAPALDIGLDLAGGDQLASRE